MTDPQNPYGETPPPAGPPAYDAAPAAPAGPPAYSAPAAPPASGAAGGYAAAPPAPYGAPVSPTVPGRTLGIVALVLAIVPIGLQLVGLILGIVALVQSKKAGAKNGFALAAIIVSAVVLLIGIIVLIVVLAVVVPAATAEFLRLCSEYGNGVHEIGGTTVTLSGCPS